MGGPRAQRGVAAVVLGGVALLIWWWSWSQTPGQDLLAIFPYRTAAHLGLRLVALLMAVLALKNCFELATWPEAAPGDVACPQCGRPTAPDALTTPAQALRRRGLGWLVPFVWVAFAVLASGQRANQRASGTAHLHLRSDAEDAGPGGHGCPACAVGLAVFLLLLTASTPFVVWHALTRS